MVLANHIGCLLKFFVDAIMNPGDLIKQGCSFLQIFFFQLKLAALLLI